MILVDSSVWIMVLRGELDLLARLPHQRIATCPAVVQEVLQGVTPKLYPATRAVLMQAEMLDAPVPLERFEEAARLFRHCQDRGVPKRSTFDFLIAACAIQHDIALLHNDQDFNHIASVTALRAIPA